MAASGIDSDAKRPLINPNSTPEGYYARVVKAISDDFAPNIIPINIAAGVGAMAWEAVSIAEAPVWGGNGAGKYAALSVAEGMAACIGFWATRRIINNQILTRLGWKEFGEKEKNIDAKREAFSGLWPAVTWQAAYDASTAIHSKLSTGDFKVTDFASFAWRSDDAQYAKELAGLGIFAIPSLISKVPYSGFWIANWQEVLMTWFGAVGFGLATDYTIKNNIPLVLQTALDGTVGDWQTTLYNIAACGVGQFVAGTAGGVLFHFFNELPCPRSSQNNHSDDNDDLPPGNTPLSNSLNQMRQQQLAKNATPSHSSSGSAVSIPVADPTNPSRSTPVASSATPQASTPVATTVQTAVQTAVGLLSATRLASMALPAIGAVTGLATGGSAPLIAGCATYTAKNLYHYYQTRKAAKSATLPKQSTVTDNKQTVSADSKQTVITDSKQVAAPRESNKSWYASATSYLPSFGLFSNKKPVVTDDPRSSVVAKIKIAAGNLS